MQTDNGGRITQSGTSFIKWPILQIVVVDTEHLASPKPAPQLQYWACGYISRLFPHILLERSRTFSLQVRTWVVVIINTN